MAEIITAPRATGVDNDDLMPLYDAQSGQLQALAGNILYGEYGNRVASSPEAAGLPDTGLLALCMMLAVICSI